MTARNMYRTSTRAMALTLNCLDAIDEAIKTLPPLQQEALWKCPVRFLKASASRAGQATTYRLRDALTGTHNMLHEIALHPKLRTMPGDEERKTFLHEVGHAIAHLRGGEGGHDRVWFAVMADLGEPHPEVTHAMALNAAHIRPIARCTKCSKVWSRTRRPGPTTAIGRSLARGTAVHPNCGGNVVGC